MEDVKTRGWDDKNTWSVDWINLNQGVWMYLCRTIELNVPLGFVYGMPLGKTFFIMGMYIPKWARRQGVATFICDYISKRFPSLTTQGGSKEGGKAFIKKYGFHYDNQMGWIYKKKGL